MKLNSLLPLLALLTSGPARAHDTQTYGNVSVTMSTGAGDKLRVNADTPVYFELRHKDAALPVAQCNCTLLVYLGQPSARVQPLKVVKLGALPDGKAGALLTITQAGQYSLVLDGRPLKYGDFDPFKAQYQLTAAENVVGGK